MNFDNCKRIMRKDWKTSIKQKEILIPMLFLPLIFTIFIPIFILLGVVMAPEVMLGDFGDIKQIIALIGIPSNYNEVLIAASIMIKLMIMPMFLMIPGLIPGILASDSFAGEKERKTMESIALLPISKIELIIGKVLTALLPSLLISFVCFGIMGVVTNMILLNFLEGNILIFTDLTFLLIVFVLSPILAFVIIIISTIISSRTRDLKTAQSWGGSLIMPIIAVLFIQMFNPAFLNPTSVIIISVILGILCLLLIKAANNLLDIEKLVLML